MLSAEIPVFGVAFDAMASRCEIRLAAGDEMEARRLAQYAIDEVQRIETKYSRYRADSIVSRINAAAGVERVECDDETLALFGYADALYQASGGLFDITSGVLRRAWNFRQATVPDAETLESLLHLIDWAGVDRDGNRIRLQRAGMEIDFGGFGKEYAADRAATALMEQGVQSGYVNLGGDMRFIGPQPDGQPWRIGIQDPRKPDGIVAVIPIAGGALATSGDYERYFEADGRRYCHILDPRSGFPVNHWRSISVLAPVAVAAGSCSTIAMLKEADGLSFLNDAGVAWLAIDNEGAIHSRNLKNLS
jgi:FAD:protein FMN transferase